VLDGQELIWSVQLYGYETWTINEQNRRELETTKMWRRLPTFSWTEMKSNIDIKLKQVGAHIILLKIVKEKIEKMFSQYLLRHN